MGPGGPNATYPVGQALAPTGWQVLRGPRALRGVQNRSVSSLSSFVVAVSVDGEVPRRAGKGAHGRARHLKNFPDVEVSVSRMEGASTEVPFPELSVLSRVHRGTVNFSSHFTSAAGECNYVETWPKNVDIVNSDKLSESSPKLKIHEFVTDEVSGKGKARCQCFIEVMVVIPGTKVVVAEMVSSGFLLYKRSKRSGGSGGRAKQNTARAGGGVTRSRSRSQPAPPLGVVSSTSALPGSSLSHATSSGSLPGIGMSKPARRTRASSLASNSMPPQAISPPTAESHVRRTRRSASMFHSAASSPPPPVSSPGGSDGGLTIGSPGSSLLMNGRSGSGSLSFTSGSALRERISGPGTPAGHRAVRRAARSSSMISASSTSTSSPTALGLTGPFHSSVGSGGFAYSGEPSQSLFVNPSLGGPGITSSPRGIKHDHSTPPSSYGGVESGSILAALEAGVVAPSSITGRQQPHRGMEDETGSLLPRTISDVSRPSYHHRTGSGLSGSGLSPTSHSTYPPHVQRRPPASGHGHGSPLAHVSPTPPPLFHHSSGRPPVAVRMHPATAGPGDNVVLIAAGSFPPDSQVAFGPQGATLRLAELIPGHRGALAFQVPSVEAAAPMVVAALRMSGRGDHPQSHVLPAMEVKIVSADSTWFTAPTALVFQYKVNSVVGPRGSQAESEPFMNSGIPSTTATPHPTDLPDLTALGHALSNAAAVAAFDEILGGGEFIMPPSHPEATDQSMITHVSPPLRALPGNLPSGFIRDPFSTEVAMYASPGNGLLE